VVTNAEMGKTNAATAYGSGALNPSAIAIPCGLIAKSFFNDEYT